MKSLKALLVPVLAIGLVSCVSRKDYDALHAHYKECIESAGQKESTISELRSRVDGHNRELNLLKEQNEALKSSLDACLSNNAKGSGNIDKLIGEINSSNAYIKQLIATNTRKDSLNTALSDKLKRSLDDVNDQDIQVKVTKGVVMISLSDNMLFKSGKHEVLPAAEVVLGKVAKVLNDYDGYDVLVEGNTDNKKMSGNGFMKDNWDLSALRSTSVVRILQSKFGVDPSRMIAGGRSEYNPKADNNSVSGRAINRRTEIIIMPKLDEFMKLMDVPNKN